MTYIDSAILNFTERICRRFQTWTGRTNLWLAFQLTNLSIVVYFLWGAALYWLSGNVSPRFPVTTFRVFVALFCAAVFFLLTRTIFKTSIETSEAEAYRRVAKGVRNPRRIRDAQIRISFLTISFLIWSILLSYPLWPPFVTPRFPFVLLTGMLIALTTAVLYMLACDPLPPCAGKVREWLARPSALSARFRWNEEK
jgi:hypothetical protein